MDQPGGGKTTPPWIVDENNNACFVRD